MIMPRHIFYLYVDLLVDYLDTDKVYHKSSEIVVVETLAFPNNYVWYYDLGSGTMYTDI